MGKPFIYGLDISPPVRAVLLTAKAIDLDFDYKEVDLFNGEHKSEEYLKINPQHTVPTLDDNGKIIWDSHAIVTYLIEKYGKDDSLYPKDLYKRALINQRLYFTAGVLFPRFSTIVKSIIAGKTEISKENIQAIFEAYDFLEKFLEKDLYIIGNTLSVADFPVIANLSSLREIVPFDSMKYPKIVDWMQRMSKLPYYEEVNGRGAKEHVKFIQEKLKQNNK